jgi:hypothetical protein
VEAVDFYLDGKLIGTDTATPYAAAWPYPTLGAHTVLAVARDTDGATATARSVVTAVEEAPPPPPGGTSWQVSFQPSIDHVALVDRYVLELYKTGGTRSLAATKDLGWPPVVAGECVVDISAAVSRLPAGTYEAVLRAVDDATFASSAVTVFFTR